MYIVTLGSSVDECIHGEVLQENLKMLVRDMDLSDGFILDGMLQNGSLTDNETQEIRELTRADKSRKLVTILGRKNKNKFKKFLKLIDEKHFYPHIAKALRQSYEEKLNAQENHHKCVRCFIIKKVDIKHILDHLCENHVFDLQEMNYFIKKTAEMSISSGVKSLKKWNTRYSEKIVSQFSLNLFKNIILILLRESEAITTCIVHVNPPSCRIPAVVLETFPSSARLQRTQDQSRKIS